MVCHFKSKIQLWDLSLIFSVDHQITGVDGANMICRRHSERARKSTKNNNVLIKLFFTQYIPFHASVVLLVAIDIIYSLPFLSFNVALERHTLLRLISII